MLGAVSELHKLFRDRELDKSYEALVCGHVVVNNGSEVSNGGIVDSLLQRDHERPLFMRVATPQSEHDAVQVLQDLQHPSGPWKDKIKRKKPKPSQTEFTVLAHETISSNNNIKEGEELPVTIYGEASSNDGFADNMDVLNPLRCSLQLQKQINSN